DDPAPYAPQAELQRRIDLEAVRLVAQIARRMKRGDAPLLALDKAAAFAKARRSRLGEQLRTQRLGQDHRIRATRWPSWVSTTSTSSPSLVLSLRMSRPGSLRMSRISAPLGSA